MKTLLRILALMLALTVTLGLVACGSKEELNPETPSTESTEPSSETGEASATSFAGQTLDIGIWGGNDQENRSIEQVKADFEELTGATVNFKVYTDYNVQMEADFIAKTAPDVFYVDASMFNYFQSLDVLVPLDREEMGTDAYYENTLNAFVGKDNEVYAIPKDFSTLAVYYNIDLLEAVSMKESDIPTAWEDYVEFLPTLQGKLDEKFGKGKIAASTYNLELARNLHLLTRNGTNLIDENGNATINTPDVIQHLNFIKSLVDTGGYKRPADLGAGWNGEAFGSGQTVLMDEGNWVYGTLKNDFPDINFGVRDMHSYQGEKSSMLFTVGYGIYAGTEKLDLAKAWIQYATGPDGMYTWCSGVGTLPTRQDVADKLDYSNDAALETHLAQVQYSIPWQLGQYAPIIDTAYQNFMLEAMNGQISIEEAAKQVDEQANLQIQNG